MKALRFILPILVILAVIGLLAYEGLVVKTLTGSNLVRGGLIIAAAVVTLTKTPTQKTTASKKALYQKAYPEFIQEPFADDPKLEKRFYDAVHNYNQNKPASAISQLEKLRRECRNSGELRSVTVFTALCYDDIGRYQESLKLYDAARQIRDCSTLASNMGLCCNRLGDFGRAAELYGQAIQMDSKNAVAYSNLSNLYFAQGQLENSLDAATDALACNERMPQALATAAICCKLLGRDGEYEDYYHRAVAAGYDGARIKKVIKKLDPKV